MELGEWYEYHEFLCRQWAQREPFVLVEQDVLPYPGAISELWDCRSPFCGKPYRIGHSYRACFGCTKFDTRLMEAYPRAMEWAAMRPQPPGPGDLGYNHWQGLDLRFCATIRELGWCEASGGMWPHQHYPVVEHLRFGPDEPPIPKPPRIPAQAAWRLSHEGPWQT